MDRRYVEDSSVTLFVDNLPLTMNNVWLRQIFKNDGRLIDAFVSRKQRRNNQFWFGFVRLINKKDAEKAIKRNNGLEVKGCKLKVSWAKYSSNNSSASKVVPRHVNSGKNKETKMWKPTVRDARSYKEVVLKAPVVWLNRVEEYEEWLQNAVVCFCSQTIDIDVVKNQLLNLDL